MQRRIYSSLCSTVRVGFNTVRLADIYNERTRELGEKKRNAGHISIVDTGKQTTISGSGEIFEIFQKTGLIKKFSGFGTKAMTFFDENFTRAPLRKMNFDETYYKMHYDCRYNYNLYPILMYVIPSCGQFYQCHIYFQMFCSTQNRTFCSGLMRKMKVCYFSWQETCESFSTLHD